MVVASPPFPPSFRGPRCYSNRRPSGSFATPACCLRCRERRSKMKRPLPSLCPFLLPSFLHTTNPATAANSNLNRGRFIFRASEAEAAALLRESSVASSVFQNTDEAIVENGCSAAAVVAVVLERESFPSLLNRRSALRVRGGTRLSDEERKEGAQRGRGVG